MKNDYSTAPVVAAAGSPAQHGPVAVDDTPAAPSRGPTTRSRIVWFVVAFAAAALTARFGVWQLSRAHQKIALAAEIADHGRLPPLATADLARDAATGAGQFQRRIVLTGRWDAAHTVFLMNRTMDERSGFFVMTPLRLPSGDAVVVQRGWIARDDADPMKAPAIATPDGDVRVAGHVAPWPSHWIDLGRGAPGPVRQNLEAAPFAAEAGVALRPVTVVEDASPDHAADGLRRDWAAPDLGLTTHYGYAAQWFGMSMAFLGVYAWQQFFRRRPAASPSDVRSTDSRTGARVDPPSP